MIISIKRKKPGTHGFTGEFHEVAKGSGTEPLRRVLEVDAEGTPPSAFHEAGIAVTPETGTSREGNPTRQCLP